eukprot:scaffold1297_cov368-Prasinococcus_capsulatus_cf.AAC.8
MARVAAGAAAAHVQAAAEPRVTPRGCAPRLRRRPRCARPERAPPARPRSCLLLLLLLLPARARLLAVAGAHPPAK